MLHLKILLLTIVVWMFLPGTAGLQQEYVHKRSKILVLKDMQTLADKNLHICILNMSNSGVFKMQMHQWHFYSPISL